MKRVVFVGKRYQIEPLGLMLLAGVAKDEGCDVSVVLIQDFDYGPLFDELDRQRPDLVCFSIWTGYHVQTFKVCDAVMTTGIPVAIGGPHATYFTDECARHATWVVKGEGFRPLKKLLRGELAPGIHHDKELMADGFPVSDRSLVYDRYPELAKSPIKSIMASVGCPFHCSYCYAPVWNEMHGGFSLHCRSIDDIVREAKAIQARWPAKLIYFQDDVFGFDMNWLREFCRRWPQEVGMAWHCQIRLELTQKQVGLDRLRLFKEGGCTGITVAIESGNPFLREYVLLRGMTQELIMQGTRRIREAGLALRTEQILSVPFSNLTTDLETLEMNCEINPEMAWTSILAPYGGTKMGQIASQMGFYAGNNDDLTETFFDRSVLQHYVDGIEVVQPLVEARKAGPKDNPLLRMTVDDQQQVRYMDEVVGRVRKRTEAGNNDYSDRIVMLQRLFNWFSKVPYGHQLARRFICGSKANWTRWELQAMTREHMYSLGMGYKLVPRFHGGDFDLYYAFMPNGDQLRDKMAGIGAKTDAEFFTALGREARHHLFDTALYGTKEVVQKGIMEGAEAKCYT